MIIGNLPPLGTQPPLNKWVIALEIYPRPPHSVGWFKPYIRIVCVKIADFGEPDKFNGRAEKKKGGVWTWTCPYGISIEITH